MSPFRPALRLGDVDVENFLAQREGFLGLPDLNGYRQSASRKAETETMPKYAIVTVIDAPDAENAWERVGEYLLNGNLAKGPVAYVGAPWLVPSDIATERAEYGTEAICLWINDRRVDLDPAD